MASVVLNADAGYDQLYANGVLSGGRGLTTSGGVVAQSCSVQAPKNAQTTLIATATGDGTAGNVAVLSLSETQNALTNISYNQQLGCGGGGGSVPEGTLQWDAYVGGGFAQALVNIAPCPRGSAGPPVIPPNSALFNLTSAVQSGVATIPIGAATIAVPLTSIGASAVVVFSPLSPPDATCIGIHAVITAGTGFSLTGAANATAAVPLSWFVVHI